MATLEGTIINESEDFIDSLTYGSSKYVSISCPDCGKERQRRYSRVVSIGHTFCDSCSKKRRGSALLIGKSIGRLTVVSYAPDHISEGKRRTMMNCICECGEHVIVRASHLSTQVTLSCGCLFLEKITGTSNTNYNHNLTEEERLQSRRRPKQDSWSRKVRKRDNYTCQVCGSQENLLAHHLDSYSSNKELRYDVGNGITICRECHLDFHKNFMGNYKTPCTAEDFDKYLIQV